MELSSSSNSFLAPRLGKVGRFLSSFVPIIVKSPDPKDAFDSSFFANISDISQLAVDKINDQSLSL